MWFGRNNAAPMQPPRPRPTGRANTAFYLIAATILAVIVMGAFFIGVFSYGGVPALGQTGQAAPQEPDPRQPIHNLPETQPPRDPPPQSIASETPSAPAPPPEPIPPPVEPPPPQPPAQPPAPQVRQIPDGPMFARGNARSGMSQASVTSQDTLTPAERAAMMRDRSTGDRQGLAPRNAREEYAAMAGRGRSKIYHDAAIVQPPPGQCVLRGSDIWPLEAPQEIQTALPGGFTMLVVADVMGRIYDGIDSIPCEYPAIPSGTVLDCEGNVSDIRRGDKAVQGVCSLATFPGGSSLPLDGFMLTAANGMVGVPAESRYNWGDEIKGTAIDLLGAIPGALLNFATLGTLGGLADVAVNIGTNNFQRSTQMYRQQEHKVVPVLYIPAAAPAGLRPGVMVALPDEIR